MTRPLVTAFMSVFNAEPFLTHALESVLGQDYASYEIVVCDDGSTDRTPEILASYEGITTIRQRNRGPSAGRNAAIRVSAGAFLACFDGDDLWPPNRLSLQATYLLEHPEVGCVLGRQEWMNPPAWLGRDAVFGDLDGIPVASAMFRRKAFDDVGGFDETFRHSEDLDLLVRMRERGIGIAILDDVILFRRHHDAQLTATAPPQSPLLRSLRQKLERQRAGSDAAE